MYTYLSIESPRTRTIFYVHISIHGISQHKDSFLCTHIYSWNIPAQGLFFMYTYLFMEYPSTRTVFYVDISIHRVSEYKEQFLCTHIYPSNLPAQGLFLCTHIYPSNLPARSTIYNVDMSFYPQYRRLF